MRRAIGYLPAVLWMALIFFGSTEAGAPQRTSRIIGPILRWFKPDLSDQAVSNVQWVIRKSAHATEYAVLALLLWRGRRAQQGWKPVGSGKELCWIWLGCVLYAASDELHQNFVASRHGSGWDVLLDSAGAAGGLALLWWFRYRKRAQGVEASSLNK